jgi:hypothetical protein
LIDQALAAALGRALALSNQAVMFALSGFTG